MRSDFIRESGLAHPVPAIPLAELACEVRLIEVGPRDGLQNEALSVALEDRVQLIESLAEAGLPVIEAGAFVSAKWVPQMADTDRVLAKLLRRPGTAYPVLVPNQKGLTAALAAGADEIAIFGAASEAFSKANINCSIAESLARFAPVCTDALDAGVKIRGYISCVIGCPYSGAVSAVEVARLAESLLRMGCYEVSLGDTIGVGTPGVVRHMLTEVAHSVPIEQLAVHFHDSWGQALANILIALEMGVTAVDSAVAGLGGCPYAKGASGNVATEDVLYMLEGLGVKTGVDLYKVAAAGRFICARLDRPPSSKAALALAACLDQG